VRILTTQIIVGENEGLENALKRFKRKCQKDGVIQDIRRKIEYNKPSVAKKMKSDAARKRARKEARG
jgi:small subunit ribosomal protein S21